jgi:hypothetical protein
LSQPLAASLTREEPSSHACVTDVPTVVPPPPSEGVDGGGPTCHRHLASHWHHHGDKREPLSGGATPRCHGRSPTGPPKPRETKMLGVNDLTSSAEKAPPSSGGRAPPSSLSVRYPPLHVTISIRGHPPPHGHCRHPHLAEGAGRSLGMEATSRN